MTIRKKRSNSGNKVKLDLTGPDGNAFVLLGWAAKTARALGADYLMARFGKTANEIQDELMSSDYENLVESFDKYFGDYFILYR